MCSGKCLSGGVLSGAGIREVREVGLSDSFVQLEPYGAFARHPVATWARGALHSTVDHANWAILPNGFERSIRPIKAVPSRNRDRDVERETSAGHITPVFAVARNSPKVADQSSRQGPPGCR